MLLYLIILISLLLFSNDQSYATKCTLETIMRMVNKQNSGGTEEITSEDDSKAIQEKCNRIDGVNCNVRRIIELIKIGTTKERIIEICNQ